MRLDTPEYLRGTIQDLEIDIGPDTSVGGNRRDGRKGTVYRGIALVPQTARIKL